MSRCSRRLLGKVSRSFQPTDLPPPSKIRRMSALQPKQLFLRSLRRGASIPEALVSTYLYLLHSNSELDARLRFTKTLMEPFVESYYPSFSTNSSSGNSDSALDIPGDSHFLPSSQERNLILETRDRFSIDRQRYIGMRKWKACRRETWTSDDSFLLRILSFNILAQYLLEAYPYLYKAHDERALPWDVRMPLIQREIIDAQANVICLQEVQQEHLQDFLQEFTRRGYNYVYKKRTNDKRDGLLFLYRSDQFLLLECAKVELYQSGIELLSRDNVAIVAKLATRENPENQLVIATTHLLYNPKRDDVRLGQTQLLLAEIERIAFIENTESGARYLPIILAGDFNLEPYTGVYEFLTRGFFKYDGKGRNLEPTNYRKLTNSLIPARLYVTDNCQHLNVLKKRLLGEGNGRVMLENTEYCAMMEGKNSSENSSDFEVNVDSTESQTIELGGKVRAKFSSGILTHPFELRSVYRHAISQSEREATTNQGNWITVDYIFYSDLEPLEIYSLPTVSQCSELPTIPNFAVGSDHLSLGATFRLFKRNC